jgi:hypothetical protein
MLSGRVTAALGLALLLGACVMHVTSSDTAPAPSVRMAMAPPQPPSTRGPVSPPPPLTVIPHPPPAAAPPPPPNPVRAAAPPPAPQAAPPRPLRVLHLSGRIVHPPPLPNLGVAHLNLAALRLMLKPMRRCGPRESTPGHWIHIDCTQYTAVKSAKPFSGRKLQLMLRGGLKLDTAVQAKIPDGVDHRNDGTEGPIKDQGQVGACTSFSLSTAMDNAIRRLNKADTVSSLHIWSHYGYPDLQTAGDSNLNKPIATWDTWPYDERVACELDRSGDGDCGPYTPPVVPGAASVDPIVQTRIHDSDSKGHWIVTEIDTVPNDPETMASVLATGADVWLSMNIGDTWMSPSGDTIGDWTQAQVEGGHAIVLAGYRGTAGRRQFLVHNSWGNGWADGGYGWISENAVRTYTKHAYKIVVADTSTPPPPPSDPNALTDDDCGSDQLVDSVTGQCVLMCPDDSRPANGKCS